MVGLEGGKVNKVNWKSQHTAKACIYCKSIIKDLPIVTLRAWFTVILLTFRFSEFPLCVELYIQQKS